MADVKTGHYIDLATFQCCRLDLKKLSMLN